jgi:hypothetical protein
MHTYGPIKISPGRSNIPLSSSYPPSPRVSSSENVIAPWALATRLLCLPPDLVMQRWM